MLRSVHKRSVRGGVFLCCLGLMFVIVGIHWLVEQEFRFGKRGARSLVTPETHPVFFWAWPLGQIAVGCFVAWRGVVDARYALRQQRAQGDKADQH